MDSLIIYLLIAALSGLIIRIIWKINQDKWPKNGGLWFNKNMDDLF